MKKSLRDFHFDPEKSGQILKAWAKAAGKGYQKIADETNYSYDTINNSLSGKIKELSLERVFKISVCTGHSVCDYIRSMLLDEDIDFADQIHVLRDANMALVPYADTLPPAPQNPVQNAESSTKLSTDRTFNLSNLEQLRSINDAYVNIIEQNHADTLEKLEKAHQEHVATMRKVARQRLRWIMVLSIILTAIVVWFIWDLTHPEIGLIRLKQMGYIGRMV